MAGRTDPVLLVLADMPDVVAALLTTHKSTSSGYCRECGMPGTGSPYLPWPCSLWGIAARARTIRLSRIAKG
jgi:hypothetical protein